MTKRREDHFSDRVTMCPVSNFKDSRSKLWWREPHKKNQNASYQELTLSCLYLRLWHYDQTWSGWEPGHQNPLRARWWTGGRRCVFAQREPPPSRKWWVSHRLQGPAWLLPWCTGPVTPIHPWVSLIDTSVWNFPLRGQNHLMKVQISNNNPAIKIQATEFTFTRHPFLPSLSDSTLCLAGSDLCKYVDCSFFPRQRRKLQVQVTSVACVVQRRGNSYTESFSLPCFYAVRYIHRGIVTLCDVTKECKKRSVAPLCVFPVCVHPKENPPKLQLCVCFHGSRASLRNGPPRRWMTCWRATWASGIWSWVRASSSHSPPLKIAAALSRSECKSADECLLWGVAGRQTVPHSLSGNLSPEGGNKKSLRGTRCKPCEITERQVHWAVCTLPPRAWSVTIGTWRLSVGAFSNSARQEAINGGNLKKKDSSTQRSVYFSVLLSANLMGFLFSSVQDVRLSYAGNAVEFMHGWVRKPLLHRYSRLMAL